MDGQLDVSILHELIRAIFGATYATIDAYIPAGVALANNLLIITIVLVGVSIASGAGYLTALVNMTGRITGVLWCIESWPTIVESTHDGIYWATAKLVPSYAGPANIFGMAIDVAGRIELEQLSLTWIGMFAANGAAATKYLFASVTLIGLSIMGWMALLAEFTFILGAAAAPLILPFMAFPLTHDFGWRVMQFIVVASVRCMVTGALSHIFSTAITTYIALPGVDATLPHESAAVVALLAAMCAMFGIEAYKISGMLVGGANDAVGAQTLAAAARRAVGTLAAGMGGSAGGGTVRETFGGSKRGGGPGGGGGGASPTSPIAGGSNVGSTNGASAVSTSSGTGSPWGMAA